MVTNDDGDLHVSEEAADQAGVGRNQPTGTDTAAQDDSDGQDNWDDWSQIRINCKPEDDSGEN